MHLVSRLGLARLGLARLACVLHLSIEAVGIFAGRGDGNGFAGGFVALAEDFKRRVQASIDGATGLVQEPCATRDGLAEGVAVGDLKQGAMNLFGTHG